MKTIDILTGLANENRLQVFLALLERDFCVCELQEVMNMEQSRLSHQLWILKFYGLVQAKQEGRWIVYSVPEDVRKNPLIQAIKKSAELPPSVREKIPRIRLRTIREDEKAKSGGRLQE